MAIPPGLSGMLHDGLPVTPRQAASVLVVDRTENPWRLLMVRRPGGVEFAPSAYVFPGGSVHESDAAYPDSSRAAALRELFEEVGILLALGGDGRLAGPHQCEEVRQLLAEGVRWPAALERAGLTLAVNRLVFLARWITPERLARRFDTRFFLAPRPPKQDVHPQPAEVEDWLWVSPGQALAGELTLVHATRRVLESVAAEPDARRLFARLRRRRGETPPVRPRIVELPGGGFSVVEEVATAPPPAGASQRHRSRQRS
jgi:8-oxo-dGTP pyrophosphatase MutT (NUDIX family)